jgi:hypothetical protein
MPTKKMESSEVEIMFLAPLDRQIDDFIWRVAGDEYTPEMAAPRM